jgi:hypothetical protein
MQVTRGMGRFGAWNILWIMNVHVAAMSWQEGPFMLPYAGEAWKSKLRWLCSKAGETGGRLCGNRVAADAQCAAYSSMSLAPAIHRVASCRWS